MKNETYYLALDIGTTNWKAAVFDGRGTMADIERTPARAHRDEQGYSFYDPGEVWDTVCGLCKTVTARSGKRISGVSVTGFAEAVVPIDRDGKAAGEIITWFDTRSMEQAGQLKAWFGEKRLYEITGLDVNPIFSLPKMMWVRQHRPEVYDRTCSWLQMADYLLFMLTGEMVTDYTLASRTLAFDVVGNRWSEEILERAGIPVETLPEIVESGTVIGVIDGKMERLTGITQGAKVIVGGNDHPCASIAAGAMKGDKILDSSGTAESFLFISERGARPRMEFRGQRICRYLEKERYVLWGGIISSGRSFDWAYDVFVSSEEFGIRQEPYTCGQVLRQIPEADGMGSGLFFYPHLRGAGAPYWNPKITGSFVGIRDTHTSKSMLKAVLEGLCMQARMIVEMEEQLAGRKAETLCVVGGSSRNLQWQTLKAAIVGKPVELCFEPEATALGAAMLAAIGDGRYRDIEEVSNAVAVKNRRIEPDETLAGNYRYLYELYRDGYEQMQAFSECIYDSVRKNEVKK